MGASWYLDETYVKVAGRWCYLYRAIDRDGQLIDSMLSEKRDKRAARRFLRRLVEVAGVRSASRRTVTLRTGARSAGSSGEVQHQTTQYPNNFMEQDHRAVKQL